MVVHILLEYLIDIKIFFLKLLLFQVVNMDVDNPSDFSDLQQQALQLTADMDTGTDLPRVERNLTQIFEAGQRLLAKVGPISQDATDVKACVVYHCYILFVSG